MKITVVVRNFEGRGVQRAQLRMAHEYLRRGHEVDIIAFERDGQLARFLPDSAHVVYFDCANAYRSLPQFVRHLMVRRPDALISAEDHVNVVVLLAKLFSANLHTRTSVSCRVSPYLWYSTDTPRLSKRGLLGGLVSKLYPLASARVMLSGDMAQEYVELFHLDRSSLDVIPNPVTLAQEPVEPTTLHPWLESPDKTVVLSVGALTKLKGTEFLIRSFARSARNNSALRLLIVGTGPEREWLEELAGILGVGEWVQFLGFQHFPSALMRRADIFVLSSRSEGFGNVLAEAICAGCSPISTTCGGGARWLMEDGMLGPMVSFGDERALEKAIDHVVAAPVAKSILEASARRFSVERVADQYLQALGLEPGDGN